MNIREKKTQQYLEKLGFIVHTVQKPAISFRNNAPVIRKYANHDIFGRYDHVAIATENTEIEGIAIHEREVIFVQTKSIKQYGKQRDYYLDFIGNAFIFVWKKEKNRYVLQIQRKENENSKEHRPIGICLQERRQI